MNQDLVEYLKERLREEEQIAVAATPGPWEDSSPGSVYVEQAGVEDAHLIAEFPPCEDHEYRPEFDAGHVATWDPARVLADIEAKRKILDAYEEAAEFYNAPANRSIPAGEAHGLWTAVQLLVQPYSSRPDFNEDWRTP